MRIRPKKVVKGIASISRLLFKLLFSVVSTFSRPLARRLTNISHLALAAAILTPLLSTVILEIHSSRLYRVLDNEKVLLSQTSVKKDLIKDTEDSFLYNRKEELNVPGGDDPKLRQLLLSANKEDSTGKQPYQAELPKNPKDGITFGDAEGNRQFTITPDYGLSTGRMDEDSRIIYPKSTTERHIYTFKRNGIKNDITLLQAPAADSDTDGTIKTYTYTLDLGNDLEARQLPSGDIGIYSANPTLFGDIQVGDDKSQDLINKARANSQKDTLVFEIPRPFIIDSSKKKNYDDVSFILVANQQNSTKPTLQLQVRNLKNLPYPVSVDPTITVTSTSDFQSNIGNNDNIDFSTSGQITRGSIGGGAVSIESPYATGGEVTSYIGDGTNGTNGAKYWVHRFTSIGSSTFTTNQSLSVEYLIVGGGGGGGAANTTIPGGGGGAGGLLTNVGGALRNISGSYTITVGSEGAGGAVNSVGGSGTNSSFDGLTAFGGGGGGSAGNGLTGGSGGGAAGYGTTTSGTRTGGTGTAGQGSAGGNSTTISSAGSAAGGGGGNSAVGSNGSTTVAGNGGGSVNSSITGTSTAYAGGGGGGKRNTGDTGGSSGGAGAGAGNFGSGSSASIANRGAGGGGGGNSGVGGDGSEGVVVIRYADPSPSTFNTARQLHSSVVYNGYLYIIGGWNGTTRYNDIQYCPINANGSVGTCVQQNNMFTARFSHSSVVYNGYLYIIGGNTGTFGGYIDDITRCLINPINGSVGTCAQQGSVFVDAREGHSSVVYNGYLYIIGGWNGVTPVYYNDIQYCPINANGSVGTCVQQTNAFTTARRGHSSVVYNGYLYIIGGRGNSGSDINDIQYCPINANGSVGTCVQQTNAFTTARLEHATTVYNGYLYIIGGWNGTTRYNDIQYCPINANGSVGTCVQQSNAFTTARAGHTSVVYNGYFYIIGGNSGSLQNDIQSIKIQNSFVPGQTISNITGFSNNRDNHSTLAYNGYLYIAGGTNGTTQYNDIQYCPINADGSVGTCVQQSNAFTIPRNAHQSVIYNGFIFIIAGDIGDGTNLSDIQRCTINVDGSIASPCEYAGDISERRRQFSAVFYNNYIYVIGGYTDTDTSTIERCPVSASGVVSACTVQSGLFVARHAHSSVIYNGYLYIIGGVISNSGAPSTWNYLSQILVCEINQSTGAVGLCSPTSNLSTGKRSTSVVVTNNYLYVVGGGLSILATTQYDDIEYCPINSNGTVGTCVRKTGALNGARQKHSSVLYDGVLYITGGQSGSVTKLSDIQYLRIGPPDGRTTASWTATTAFATARFGHTTVVYNGFIYVIGGLNSSGSYLNDVQYASINTDGTIGAWAPDVGTSFTNERRGHTSVVYRGYLYVIGGWNGSTYYNDVQKAPINVGGDIGTWATTTSFSTSRYQHTTVVNNGYLYVIGGRPSTSSTACNPTAAQQCNDVQFSLINESDGTVGAWNYTFNSASSGTYSNGFTDGRWGHASVVYNNYIYILGGYNGTYYNTVQYAAVNSDGTVGTWQSTTSFPTATEQHTAVVANGYIYLIGGYNALDTVHYVSISNNGELNSWSATNSFTTGRHGHASAISNGFVYITGGCSLSTCTTYQSDVQYAPLGGGDYTSRYERTIDTLSAANTVTSFTIDGSALCNYRVSYKLAGSDNIYGSETIVSDVRAGISQTITGGANKRYVAFVVTLDDSLCGGTSTITALSLAYNAVPSSPTLSRPTNGASSIGTLPEFRLDSSDDIDTYLKYKIEVCSTSNCSSVVRTIDQTVSQVGWASRIEFRAGTTSATQYATHNYQTPALSPNTQYWWRAYAIDPNGTNVWSSASSISSFTTITEPVNSTSTVIIRGGVDMGGNVIVQP